MKKVILSFCVAGLLLVSSCTKDNVTTYGSWSFKGSSFSNALGGTSNGTGGATLDALATIPSGGQYSPSLTVRFPTQTLPTTSGTYTVANNNTILGSNQVLVEVGTTAGDAYYSTGFGSGQTVSVTVNNGKVSASGTNIMVLKSGGSDSAAVTFNISQP